MEVSGGINNKVFVCLYELMGTALLLSALNLSGPAGSTDPQAVAGAIFVAIVIFGPISGGHFNPAVTTAVYIKESINSSQNTSLLARTIFMLMIICS